MRMFRKSQGPFFPGPFFPGTIFSGTIFPGTIISGTIFPGTIFSAIHSSIHFPYVDKGMAFAFFVPFSFIAFKDSNLFPRRGNLSFGKKKKSKRQICGIRGLFDCIFLVFGQIIQDYPSSMRRPLLSCKIHDLMDHDSGRLRRPDIPQTLQNG